MSGTTPRTLAEDLRSRTDEQLVALFAARPDLLHPIPSDMRALTTRAATAPSIARYLDGIDAIHYFALRIACELTTDEPTSIDRIVEVASEQLDETAEDAIRDAVRRSWTSALLWGTEHRTHVITAVRDQVAHAPVPTWPPPACTSGHSPSQHDVDTAAGIQARSIVSLLEEVAGLWEREPGVVLRSGGLSSRAVDTLSEQLDMPRSTAECIIEIARSAGLLAVGPTDDDLGWMPTPDFDTWCAAPAERRWSTLAQAWMNSPTIITDKPLEPEEHPLAPQWRRQMLDVVGSAPGVCDADSMIGVLDFTRPRRSGHKRAAAVRGMWEEAEILGLIALGRLSTAGHRAVEEGDARQLAQAMRPHLVGEIDHVHIQADHTIVAPGPLDPRVGGRLREIADVESRGHATVFRLTTASLQRGLATRPDPTEWIAFLSEISAGRLPQPIEYAIGDAARTRTSARRRFRAPSATKPRHRTRIDAAPSTVERALRVLRSEEAREALTSQDVEVPRLESAAVVAQLRYVIDHHESVHLTYAESDGSIAVLLVDPIRLKGGSLTAYDHTLEQVRTLAVSRITGVAALRVSA